MTYISDDEAIELIIEMGKRMYMKNYVVANDGNISCKVGEDEIWTTPTGVSKGYMTKDMLVKTDMLGNIILGKNKPSSEIKMHLRVYKENKNAMAVVHAHPPIATAFSIAGIELNSPILAEAVVQLGTVKIAPYATPGTDEVANSIAPFCTKYNAVLLANHGALTWDEDLTKAYFKMETLEYYATLIMYTKNIILKSNDLSSEQVDRLLGMRNELFRK